LAFEFHNLGQVLEGEHVSARVVGFIHERRNGESEMNLAIVSGPASDVKTRKPGACADGFQTCFDLFLYVAEDAEHILAANIEGAIAGDFFSGVVESGDVALQVGSHKAAAHALDDAVVEKAIIGEVLGCTGELGLAAADAFRKL